MTLLYRPPGRRGKGSAIRPGRRGHPGTRADAIRMSSAELDGTALTVRTVHQGQYYFALDEAKSASISDRSLVLRF